MSITKTETKQFSWILNRNLLLNAPYYIFVDTGDEVVKYQWSGGHFSTFGSEVKYKHVIKEAEKHINIEIKDLIKSLNANFDLIDFNERNNSVRYNPDLTTLTLYVKQKTAK